MQHQWDGQCNVAISSRFEQYLLVTVRPYSSVSFLPSAVIISPFSGPLRCFPPSISHLWSGLPHQLLHHLLPRRSLPFPIPFPIMVSRMDQVELDVYTKFSCLFHTCSVIFLVPALRPLFPLLALSRVCGMKRRSSVYRYRWN